MSWKTVRLGEILKRVKTPVKIEPQTIYSLVTIRMYHKGVTKRGDVQGTLIKSPTMYRVSANQFILSGIDARNGAFGIVPNELNGAVVTNDFWTHDVNTWLIDLEYFYWFTSTPNFYDLCIRASEGTTNRQRLQAEKFYSFPIDLPSLEEQQALVKRVTQINGTSQILKEELTQQQTYLQLLRQTILQEAVQGKLTHREPTDEPAAALLARIKAEKAQLVKWGKLKKEKELPPITEAEMPFVLPEGWVWCRLGDIADLISGVTLGKTYKGELVKVPYLRVANVQRGFIDTSNLKELFVPESEIEKYRLQEGDICMIEGGDWDKVGRCAIWNGAISPCIHQNHVFRLRFLGDISHPWAEMYLNSPITRRYFEGCSKQTTNLASINQTQLKATLIALPPLQEQIRIEEKVSLLATHTQSVEIQVTNSKLNSELLLQTILKEAFQPQSSVYAVNESLSLAAEA